MPTSPATPARLPHPAPVDTGTQPDSAPADRAKQPFDEEPPRRPDWLLIMVLVLFMLTLSIAWLMVLHA